MTSFLRPLARRASELWAALAGVARPTRVRLAVVLGALAVGVFGFSLIGAGASGGYSIDGTVPDNASIASFSDPFGATAELGAINENTTKLGVVHNDGLPTLGFNSINPGNDLSGIWLDTKRDANNHVWLYFAWSRAESTA